MPLSKRTCYILIASILVFSMSIIGMLCYQMGKLDAEDHFLGDDHKYLNGYKLSIPEEISQMKDQNDPQPEYFMGRRNTESKIITLEFANPEDFNNHEYQFDIDQDSIHLYDGNRFVGSVPYAKPESPLDSLILNDNL